MRLPDTTHLIVSWAKNSAENPVTVDAGILDPIEGTSLYIEGSLHWSTLISLAVDGVVTTAVVDYPAAERRYWAVRGDGGVRQRQSTRGASTVSRTSRKRPSATTTATTSGVPPGVTPLFDWLTSALRCNLPLNGATRSWWWHAVKPTSLSTRAVAPGTTHPFMALVEEAGGVASDIEGEPRFDRGSLLVTNGRLHSEVLATLGS